MKNIVFIVEGYYPRFSASGVCVSTLVEELSSKSNVFIIDRKKSSAFKNTKDEYCKIIRYDYRSNRTRIFINEKLETAKGLNRRILLLFEYAVRGWGFIKFWARKTDIKKQQVRAILKELENIDEKIDLIIPLCLPVEGVAAALEFKDKAKKGVKVVPMLFDLFSENPTLHRTQGNKKRKFQKHLDFEREMCEHSDRLFFVKAWKNHLNKYFGEYESKFFQIEHPLLKRVISVDCVDYDPEKINIVYTGALYKNIRSPLFSLKLFSSLIDSDERLVLHFYINGDCDALVNSYCKKYPFNIMNHGTVPRETAKAAMLASDILLSIGNTDENQIPSKIFEYISTGKPLLHLYSIKRDPVINILGLYANSCCVESKDQIEPIDKSSVLHMVNNRREQMGFEEVERIYFDATPKYTANKILEIM